MTDGKTGKKSTESKYGVRNSLDRDKFIKAFGEEKFKKLTETDSHYKKYREPPIPDGCKWIFKKFLEIFFDCNRDFHGNVLFTFSDVNNYEQCMGVSFTIAEKKLLFKMKHWAAETISELNS